MDVERARAFLLTLPHVRETMQWGDNLVYWVGDKSIGGKMFCLMNLEGGKHGAVSFAAGPERFSELQEDDRFFPAPYFARIHWIAAHEWSAVRNAEWEALLQNAHAIMYAKLPKRTLVQLGLTEPTAAASPSKRPTAKATKPTAAKKKPTAKR